AERVAVMITDAGFHYAPDNIGEGKNVPTYEHTLNIVKDAKLQTFVISVPKPGYSENLKNLPAFPAATNGQFYDLRKVLNGSTDMAEIFNNIAGRINSRYTLTYVIENNPALDPELAFNQRLLNIEAESSLGA